MANWTLAEIRQKVRKVSGRYAEAELSTEDLDEYINKYYQYTFPAEVKLERFHTYYEFLTSANQQNYAFPDGFVNFEPLGTIDRKNLQFYQDPDSFYENNPENIARATFATGDGVTTNFSYTATSLPILPASLVVTDNTETFQDTNTDFNTSPTISGSAGGTATLNYSTGALSVSFNSAPANGQGITVSYIQFLAGLPTAVLMYNNFFTFYPVPDTAYRFRIKAYANTLVTTAAGLNAALFENATDRPLLDEWGPAIAYGTARAIHADYGELDAYAEITALYKEQLGYILRRTHQELLNTRSNPMF